MNDLMYQTSYEELITAQRALALSYLLREDSFSTDVGLHLPYLWHLVYFWDVKSNRELDLNFAKNDINIIKKSRYEKTFF